jgi:hypothetical protein
MQENMKRDERPAASLLFLPSGVPAFLISSWAAANF